MMINVLDLQGHLLLLITVDLLQSTSHLFDGLLNWRCHARRWEKPIVVDEQRRPFLCLINCSGGHLSISILTIINSCGSERPKSHDGLLSWNNCRASTKPHRFHHSDSSFARSSWIRLIAALRWRWTFGLSFSDWFGQQANPASGWFQLLQRLLLLLFIKQFGWECRYLSHSRCAGRWSQSLLVHLISLGVSTARSIGDLMLLHFTLKFSRCGFFKSGQRSDIVAIAVQKLVGASIWKLARNRHCIPYVRAPIRWKVSGLLEKNLACWWRELLRLL